MIKNNTLGARIAQALKIKGIPASIASTKLGWSLSYLSKIINGEIKELGFLRGIELSEYLNVDPVWLATGEMRSEILLVKNGNKRAIAENPDIPLLAKYVPILNWKDIGKRFKSAYDIKDKRAYPTAQMTVDAGLGAFALVVDGDSMASGCPKAVSFYENDIVFFCPDERPFIGCYVLVRNRNDHSAMFRRLEIDCGKVYLVPLNSQYPAVELKDKSAILAIAVERRTRFDEKVNTMDSKIIYLDDAI